MQQHRPEGCRGPGDAHLLGMSKELLRLLRDAQKSFSYDSIRLRKTELSQLAEILVEFVEDIHNQIGIWSVYERCNREFFGVALPFAPPGETGPGISMDRVRHLLWVLYPQLIPGLIVSPRHQDLERVTEVAHAFLNAAFRTMPKGSSIKAFLQTSNRRGYEVKRKLVWLGTQSYMFRVLCKSYLDENNRGRWDIGHVDDFLCQECTQWSGLGAIDILAGVLDIPAEDRRELRSWYERHASMYRLQKVSDEHLEALNIISNQTYCVRIDMRDHPFRPGQLVFGSLVPWRGEWYWSGEQEMWDKSVQMDVDGLCDTMKRKSSQIVCRFWKDYEVQVRQRAQELHEASLAYHGRNLVMYPDGLAMAADWQKELRAAWESKPPDQIQQVIEKHGLTEGRPDMRILSAAAREGAIFAGPGEPRCDRLMAV